MAKKYNSGKNSISELLRRIELEELQPVFEKNDISLDRLKKMTDDDLNKIGINLYRQRRKIMEEMKKPFWNWHAQEAKLTSPKGQPDDAFKLRKNGETDVDFSRPKSLEEIKKMHEEKAKRTSSPKAKSKETKDTGVCSSPNDNSVKKGDPRTVNNFHQTSVPDLKQFTEVDARRKDTPKPKPRPRPSLQSVESTVTLLPTKEKSISTSAENETKKYVQNQHSSENDKSHISSENYEKGAMAVGLAVTKPADMSTVVPPFRKQPFENDSDFDKEYLVKNSTKETVFENESDTDKESSVEKCQKGSDFLSFNKEGGGHQFNDCASEIRIVLLGKTGNGKSATGNSILGFNAFPSKSSSTSVTKKCKRGSAIRFGNTLQVVDTPGLFDTNFSNQEVKEEIVKCISITSPGPHAFILVLSTSRFTREEYDAVQYFVEYFGGDVYRFFVVLFTKKDDLDHDQITLDQHIKNGEPNLKDIIRKCNGRCIAFNNRLDMPARDQQVKDLLEMINKKISSNGNTYYTNEFYRNAEKLMQQRIMEIRKELEEEQKMKIKKIKRRSSKTIREKEEKIEEMQNQYEQNFEELQTKVVENLSEFRNLARVEVEEKKGIFDRVVRIFREFKFPRWKNNKK